MTPRVGATYIHVPTGARYTLEAVEGGRFAILAPQGSTLASADPRSQRVHDSHLHESDFQPNGLPLRRGYRLQSWEG
ncbi:hypothetical protein ACIRPH_30895 [Nocardiopsis sp. NPDC101807]|uniref:hypothetical protein n=1 Tax=Nocardiopsis sp. NPDC101807 TaxID=3364339 RepID=UPI0037F74067